MATLVPVALAFGLFAHLCTRGLGPELEERDKLEGMRAELLEVRDDLLARKANLEALSEALEDPVYAERIRRLERARAPQGTPAGLDPEAFEPISGTRLAAGADRPVRTTEAAAEGTLPVSRPAWAQRDAARPATGANSRRVR